MGNPDNQRLENKSAQDANAISANTPDFECWFRTYHDALVRWISYKIGDHDAAQDISQNAFIYLHHLAKRAEVANPRAILYKTAGWLASNEIRRRRRSLGRCSYLEDIVFGDECQTAPENSPECNAAARQEVELTLNVINALPEKARMAFRLNRMDGLTYGEVAQTMGISKSGVEKHMILALGQLRCARVNMS